ncbi:MAG: DUF1570 domain-containing protein [Planctomycetota bacterium]|nr:hypothetical protein [Planctomycetota bacterium]MEE3052181.1 DUF1570 domain-containing protein [Planctomycetota bacterium]
MFRSIALFLVMLSAAGLYPALSAQERIGKARGKIKIAWSELNTKNYKIEYEAVIPVQTAQKIGGELEDILVQYQGLFRFKSSKKMLVRFMDSENTYEQVGGDPRMAGFYNPGSGYLVIKQLPFYDLIPIVYHEAFHQYLHSFVGDVQIPIWFNEGMAVYFEGMQRDEKSKTRALSPKLIKRGKIRMVKDAINTRTQIPLETLLKVTHEEFHDKENEALYYSQSFAVMFYFMQLSRGKAALNYMKELKKTGDPEAANTKLFGKKMKNLKRIEASWKSYIRKLDTRQVASK